MRLVLIAPYILLQSATATDDARHCATVYLLAGHYTDVGDDNDNDDNVADADKRDELQRERC